MGPPSTFRQNETPAWSDDAWTDEQGKIYSAPAYALTYVIAGPSTTPVVLTAAQYAGGSGWLTTLDATNSGKLIPGVYWWQAVLTGTNFRRVIAEGEITVEVDLATLAGAYDGRTVAERALAQWEAALAAVSANPVKQYSIGDRHLTYRDVSEIQSMIQFWRARTIMEKSAAAGGSDRHILVRFDRAR